MTRIRLLSALTALLLPIASTAFAQDAEPSPEAGDVGGSEMGGDMSTGGDASATPSSDAPAGDTAAPSSGGEKPISVGLLLGYGIGLDLKGGPNPWGLGFGARGGYNIGQLYLGARFVFYLGSSKDVFNGVSTINYSFNIWELGIEGGYDLKASDALTIRPEFGLGLAGASADPGTSSTKAYIAPGASVLYDVSENIFLGVDARFQLVFTDPESVKAIIFLANAGMRF